MARRRPKVVIIAGPNGAGKTTFAEQFLPREADCPTFLNADLIARGLSPFSPDDAAFAAARIMLQQMDEKFRAGESFAFETTLSGRNYVQRIRRWRRAGWTVTLIFLSLPDVEMAIERVAARVRQGGHNIPENVIRRRFTAGLSQFDRVYKPIVSDWIRYDNSVVPPDVIEAGENL
jgi:predicted ABC-type ATPase